MAELKIADQDMYGYRTTGPNEPDTRVRIYAGTPIPPDLHSFEATNDFKEQGYPEATSAAMTAEEQQQAARNREEAIAQPSQYNPNQPETTMPVSRASQTALNTPEQRSAGQASGGYHDQTKDQLIDEAKRRGVPHGGTKEEIIQRLEEDDRA